MRAAGVNPSDWKKRKGLMDPELPETIGYEAAGVVDELGEGVADVAVGNRVFVGGRAGCLRRGPRRAVRAFAPHGVDVALDVAGSGVLPELIELAGGPEHVVTIADFAGAQEHGLKFSSGEAGRAVHVLVEIGELIESRRFSLPVAQTFALAEIAQAHRVGEEGHVRGKLVLLVG